MLKGVWPEYGRNGPRRRADPTERGFCSFWRTASPQFTGSVPLIAPIRSHGQAGEEHRIEDWR
jgi:hypothetical protein